jgi:hypothetical protein
MFSRNHFALAVLFLITGIAPASAAPTDGSIEQSVPTTTWEKIGVELYGWSYGSGLGRLDGRQPNNDGTPGDPIEVVNQISITHPTNVGLDFVLMPQFSFRPFLSDDEFKKFELKDPTFGLVGTVYQSGGFTWWARFENALPLSQLSRDDKVILAPGAVSTFSYRFARSSWELQATLSPSVSLLSGGDFKSYLYFSPRVNYIFDDSWALFTYLEAATETEAGAGLTNFTSAQDTNLGMGVRYSVAGMFFEPSINVYPFGEVQDSTTAFIGFFFGGKFK